jgi:hypothetical protein
VTDDELADRVARLQARRAASGRSRAASGSGRSAAPSTLVAEPPVEHAALDTTARHRLPGAPAAPIPTPAPDAERGLFDLTPPAPAPAETRSRRRRIPHLDVRILAAWVGALLVVAGSLVFAARELGAGDGTVTADPRGMVLVPAGRYVVGSPVPAASDAPAAVVELDDYAIDRLEVTNTEYRRFVNRTGAEPPPAWPDGVMPATLASYPVVGIPRADAVSYCASVGKRLPTEAEWEVAARGPSALPYPWGTDHGAVSVPKDVHNVARVSGDASPFGARDMYGNAHEWVGEPYAPLTSGEALLRGRGGGPARTLSDRVVVTGDEAAGDPIPPRAGVRCAADEIATTVTDDFTRVGSGWPVRTTDAMRTRVTKDATFEVTVRAPRTVARPVAGLDATDVSASATAVLASTPGSDAMWGVTARSSAAGAYACLVDPLAAEWLLVRYDGTAARVLARGKALALGAPSGSADQLGIEAHGDRIVCFVNGQNVGLVTDAEYPRGDVGFVVQAERTNGVTVTFDDFTTRLGGVGA